MSTRLRTIHRDDITLDEQDQKILDVNIGGVMKGNPMGTCNLCQLADNRPYHLHRHQGSGSAPC